MIIYEFGGPDRRGAITKWRAGLQARGRAALDAKTKLLRRFGFDLPPKLLAGPLRGFKHLYKLRIRAGVELRPILCKGPFAMGDEVTLLFGAKEVGGKWDPPAAPDEAEMLREAVALNAGLRIRYTRDLE